MTNSPRNVHTEKYGRETKLLAREAGELTNRLGFAHNIAAMPFVYVLGTHTPRGPVSYVGWTLDIERRLAQHNAGKGARTTRGRVWSLLHSESFERREQAMSREWHLKRDRKFRKELLASRLPG